MQIATGHHRKLQQSKYQPGYVAATLADAYAEVIRAKASKYNKTEAAPQATVLAAASLPQKSKNFAYTNIRLTTAASGALAPPPPPPPLLETASITPPFIVQQQQQVPPVVVSGPRQHPATTQSPLVTNTVPALVPVPITQQTASSPLVTQNTATTSTSTASPEVQKKLAELDAQLQQLKELQAQLQAMKTASSPGRRLMDSGMPGWDSGALFEKVLNVLEGTACFICCIKYYIRTRCHSLILMMCLYCRSWTSCRTRLQHFR